MLIQLQAFHSILVGICGGEIMPRTPSFVHIIVLYSQLDYWSNIPPHRLPFQFHKITTPPRSTFISLMEVQRHIPNLLLFYGCLYVGVYKHSWNSEQTTTAALLMVLRFQTIDLINVAVLVISYFMCNRDQTESKGDVRSFYCWGTIGLIFADGCNLPLPTPHTHGGRMRSTKYTTNLKNYHKCYAVLGGMWRTLIPPVTIPWPGSSYALLVETIVAVAFSASHYFTHWAPGTHDAPSLPSAPGFPLSLFLHSLTHNAEKDRRFPIHVVSRNLT